MKKLVLTIILSCLSFLNASNLQKTSVQLNWFDQFQFAGFYTAIEKGFYKEVGLDVELKKYDNSNVLEEIINKKADFGIGSSSLIADKSDGKDIVLLGALFQSSPIILLALKNSDINYIENIKNKKIMITKEQFFKFVANSNKYEEEIDHVHDKYGMPDGRLYIAYVEGVPAGCAAFHRYDAVRCEGKRLYVRPQYRGQHIATLLMEKIMKEAKEIGYKIFLLDVGFGFNI